MILALLASAFVMGLLGSTHCTVMCGGVVAMTCSALSLARRRRTAAQLPYLLAYNAGRIASYTLAGTLVGWVGASIASFDAVQRAQLALRLVAGLMMLAAGLYIAGFAPAFAWIERAGEPVWRRIAPVAQRLVPVRSPSGAFALGLLWGWMPCGLVYAALAAAVSSGSPGAGAAAMAAFGLGTLPMLLAMGSAAACLARVTRRRWVRVAAGAAMLLLGVVHVQRAGAGWVDLSRDGPPHCCPIHGHG